MSKKTTRSSSRSNKKKPSDKNDSHKVFGKPPKRSSIPSVLKKVISYLKKGKEVAKRNNDYIDSVLSKYFGDNSIKIKAVCLANGGRSPLIQTFYHALTQEYGISKYFNINSYGSKFGDISGDRTKLSGSFKSRIVKKAVHHDKTIEKIYDSSDKKMIDYVLKKLASIKDKDQNVKNEKIDALYKSDTKFRQYLHHLDRKGIRTMHVHEAIRRDQALKDLGYFDFLLQHYYNGEAPDESQQWPTDWDSFRSVFYRGRKQLTIDESDLTTVFFAAEKKNAEFIEKQFENKKFPRPLIKLLNVEDTIGLNQEQYTHSVLDIKKQVDSSLGDIVQNVYMRMYAK